MTDIVIPFNFQPVSVSVKTSSYTIPAGKYAYVTANAIGSATFEIGGATALSGSSTTQTTNTSSTLRYGRGDGVNYVLENHLLATDASNGHGGTPHGDAFGYASKTFNEVATASYWLPAGTVISGSGTWRATVSLYNELT